MGRMIYYSAMTFSSRLPQYFYLCRIHQPIGTLLLLWPTLWAILLASGGSPDKSLFLVFMAGVVLMRAAGCIMSDIADRHFDGQVKRTRMRPLASGKLSVFEAMILMLLLSATAFLLVLYNCNLLTIELAIIGALIALVYPLLKRITYLPQLGLGVAFAWGVPMAFAAFLGSIGYKAWLLFLTSAIWPIIYDSFYALLDRDDDCKIGVKSIAILFGRYTLWMIATLQLWMMGMLVWIGFIFHLRFIYFASLIFVFILFTYQLYLAKNNDPLQCFKAFLNNNWVGVTIFIGIYLSFL